MVLMFLSRSRRRAAWQLVKPRAVTVISHRSRRRRDPGENLRDRCPNGHHHTAAAAVNGKLYIIGGYISGMRAVDSVYEYDPAVDRWTAKKADAYRPSRD